MKCRFCKTELADVFVDLGNSPASNSFLTSEQLNEPEVFYPLKVYVCSECLLVQIDEYKKSDSIFDNAYVYFSSYSKSWLEHARLYTERMIERFGFNESSRVIEIASNDGYLLQYFQMKNIPVLGIEPTANTAQVAIDKGIENVIDFFSVKLATALAANNQKADLLLGNNVLAHVPDIVDFVSGMKVILKETGVITMEFPHIMELIKYNQFDTIYHEHFSYLSLHTVKRIFLAAGLKIFDVEQIQTHGGSLRIFATHSENNEQKISDAVTSLLSKELNIGVTTITYYQHFQRRALQVKVELIAFLIEQQKLNKTIAAYGAAAKGNTLLNYCGIKNDLIKLVVDANPHKQNKYLPGSHIPVVNEESLRELRPDYIIIFPWNIKNEIIAQLSYVREWNGKFVIPIPSLLIA